MKRRSDDSLARSAGEGGAKRRVREIPQPAPPDSQAWDDFIRDRDRWQADPGLAGALRELLPDLTDA